MRAHHHPRQQQNIDQIDEHNTAKQPAHTPQTSQQQVLQLQRTRGNAFVRRSLQTGIVQRTINTAAQYFYDSGFKEVKKSHVDGKVRKAHGVKAKDWDAINTQLQVLRAAAPTTTATVPAHNNGYTRLA